MPSVLPHPPLMPQAAPPPLGTDVAQESPSSPVWWSPSAATVALAVPALLPLLLAAMLPPPCSLSAIKVPSPSSSLHSFRAPGVLGARPASGLPDPWQAVASPPPRATAPGAGATVPSRLLACSCVAGPLPSC